MKELLDAAVANGSSGSLDLNVAGNIAFVHVWSAVGSTATVQIESCNDPALEPWAPATNSVGTAIAAISNPGNPGTITQVTGRFIRATMSGYSAGSVFVSAEVRSV